MARPSKKQLAARKREKAFERRGQRLEEWAAKVEHEAFSDACEVACEDCGLVQVQSQSGIGLVCVLCGCGIGTWVRDAQPTATPLRLAA